MAVKGAVAKIWWKKIKRYEILFAEAPSTLKPEIKALAKADVVNGVITAEEYEVLIGEPYVLEE